ncbi:MAG: ATP-grasp domain-containing protein [Bacteriovoracaceae bacterium]|nr:ATP-grasp domain-containing protein [Bacteriovoracaceae bacterium]
MSKKLLILFGGSSEERLVSVASAQNLATHLPEAELVFISPSGSITPVSPTELARHANPFTTQFIPSASPVAGRIESALSLYKDYTFILALHGTEGEDGSLQKILETHKISYTGTNSKASAAAFDKKKTKDVAQTIHLPLTADLLLSNPGSQEDQKKLRDFFKSYKKIVLKPVANGSSVGLFIIEEEKQLNEAMAKFTAATGTYLAECFLEGREITVGVREHLDGHLSALPCSEVRVNKGRQFDYEGKYLGSGVQELTPAPISPEVATECQRLAMAIHKAIGCEGYSRTDMILTDRGPVLLEINTLPGLSKASFIPQQLVANGENLKSFFLEQVQLAEKRLAKN